MLRETARRGEIESFQATPKIFRLLPKIGLKTTKSVSLITKLAPYNPKSTFTYALNTQQASRAGIERPLTFCRQHPGDFQ